MEKDDTMKRGVFRDKLLAAAGRALPYVIPLAIGWTGAELATRFPVTSAVCAASVAVLWFLRRRLAAFLAPGARWVADRASDAIAATPVWVFVFGPSWALRLFVLGLCFWGLSLVLGVSANPVTNMRELAAPMDATHVRHP